MAWGFTDLPYGWKLAVGITLTGATIFTADNLRRRFTQIDDVELDLAVAERALATQYGTNALGEPLYRVAPPEYVRPWYSNAYESTVTNGTTNWTAVCYTNYFTNAVGFKTDRAKAVARDQTIKDLCQWYIDTNSVYDGTTNITMLTFTGLLCSLNLGDGTNFTSVPAWVGTNGVTNAATYGALPYRIYEADLVERYKVLNVLKMLKVLSSFTVVDSEKGSQRGFSFSDASNTWEEAKGWVQTNIVTGSIPQDAYWSGDPSLKAGSYTRGIFRYTDSWYNAGFYAAKSIFTNTTVSWVNITPFGGAVKYWVSLTNMPIDKAFYTGFARHYYWDLIAPYDANGTPNTINGSFYEWLSADVMTNETVAMSRSISSDATWCEQPSDITGHGSYAMLEFDRQTWNSWRGFRRKSSDLLFTPNFDYCTNKYW